MSPLIEQSPPRSDEAVTRLTSKLRAKVRSSTRRAAWWFFVPIGVLGVVVAILVARSSNYTVQAGFGIAFVMTGALSVPVMMLLGGMSSAVPTATKLVRQAPAYQGDVSDRAMASTNTLVVKWQENDREAVAYLNVPYELRNFDGEVTVLALPDEGAVGILLDEDFYLSARAMALFHLSAKRAG